MEKIVQKGEKVLAEKAKEVPVNDIKTPKIKQILKDMSEALLAEKDGVAIAAPQIGIPLRIFVVSGHIFDTKAVENDDKSLKTSEDLVFINPEIIKLSQKKEWLDEGCLSVRGTFGKVRRATKATVSAYNKNGEKFTRGGSGLLAQIFQHEVDHLDGTLFVEKAKQLQNIND
ncbi:peptide deformylase [Patescibacteria group bacterium]